MIIIGTANLILSGLEFQLLHELSVISMRQQGRFFMSFDLPLQAF
jgi:hypothetical protein